MDKIIEILANAHNNKKILKKDEIEAIIGCLIDYYNINHLVSSIKLDSPVNNTAYGVYKYAYKSIGIYYDNIINKLSDFIAHPNFYMHVNLEIMDTIRHEIEHVIHRTKTNNETFEGEFLSDCYITDILTDRKTSLAKKIEYKLLEENFVFLDYEYYLTRCRLNNITILIEHYTNIKTKGALCELYKLDDSLKAIHSYCINSLEKCIATYVIGATPINTSLFEHYYNGVFPGKSFNSIKEGDSINAMVKVAPKYLNETQRVLYGFPIDMNTRLFKDSLEKIRKI